MNDAAAPSKSSVDVALEALKPIRDLVKNWDIDISSCLEEFLRDLVGDNHGQDAMLLESGGGLVDGDEQQQPVDGGTGNKQGGVSGGGFSFTNAALVLDSSSRVYSRKVEYLHQLVFKALDGLAASQAAADGKQQKKKRARAAASPEILEFEAFDPMEEFLLLDDVLPTDDEAGGCRHINLPSEQHHQNKAATRTSLSGPWNNVEIARRRAGGGPSSASQSLKSPHSLSLSMVNRTAGTNTNNMNRSSIGSAALQALVGSAASGTAGHSSLRLMRMHGCTIDATGALVMPGQRQQQQQQTPANNNNSATRMSYPAMSTGNNNNNNQNNNHNHNMDIVGGLDDNDDDGPGFAMADDDHDDDDGGLGYAMVDNDTAAMPPPSTRKKGVTFCDDLPSHKRGEQAQQSALSKQDNAVEDDEEEEDDPWKLLDPHVAATEKKHKPRPLVVGMTLQLPPGVTELPSEAIARAARNNNSSTTRDGAKRNNKKLVVPRIKENKKNDTNFCNRTWAVDTFRANLKRAQQAGQQQQQPPSSSTLEELGEDSSIDLPPHIPLTGLFYGNEFEYIARATAKRKAAERREMLQQQEREQSQQQKSRHGPDGNVQPQQPFDTEIMHNDDNNNDNNEDDDDGGFGFAMGDHDDGDDNNDDVDFGGTGFDDDNDADKNNNNNDGKPKEVITNTGLTIVDQAYQTTADDDNDSAMNDRHFAALCRARIESFAKGAEKYASDTNLSKRVEKWQSKVKPMLDNEERRPVFDIHAYSQRILKSMELVLENQRAATDNENLNKDDAMMIQEEKGNPLVDFATVTQDCEQYDVCRMFLATLSLCNAGNINLQQQIDLKLPNDAATASHDDGRPRLGTLRMELLQRDISQPMDTYLDFGN